MQSAIENPADHHLPLTIRCDKPATKDSTKLTHENAHHSAGFEVAESAQHFALAAQATNDAIRDWDVTTGELSWPQGLETLLGYKRAAVSREIGFWQKNIHPEDRARTAMSIRDALAG
ncbi:MAG: hypothetical protein ACXW3Z_08510, partial [Limisphaerales bacterium]